MTAAEVVTATTAQSGKSAPNSKEASPVKVKTSSEVQEEAKTHLATGKRHLLVSDVPAAVTSLAQSCELLSTQFGETAKECAESYYYYGKALLELSRLESGVLGNALDGVPEEGDEANTSQVEDPAKMTDDEKKEVEEKVDEANTSQVEDPAKMTDDEKKEVEEKVGEALEENFQESLQKKEEKSKESKEGEGKSEADKAGESKSEESKEGDAGTEDEGMEEGDDSEAEESNGEDMDAEKSTTEGADNTEGDSEKKDEEEEPSNLQLAWEMLELAKMVYTKQAEESAVDTKAEIEEKLCSTMLALGEVSLENENYKQAVEDIRMCLKKQEILPKDSRVVAETHYQLGVALGFNSEFEEAVESLNSAIKIIKERINKIKKGIKSPKKSPTKDEKKEVTELEALIPEIEEKITDTQDMKKEAEAKTKDGNEGLTSSSGDKTESKNVTSIAVKRKADDQATASKKVVADKEKTAAAS